MATLCASSPSAFADSTAHLVSLLQDSISCAQEDAFHPVLYQTLRALHEYIGLHQRRLLSSELNEPKNQCTWKPKKTRPSFCRATKRTDGVVASGWLEELSANEDGLVRWDQVLLLLVIPQVEEKPYLRIAHRLSSNTIAAYC